MFSIGYIYSTIAVGLGRKILRHVVHELESEKRRVGYCPGVKTPKFITAKIPYTWPPILRIFSGFFFFLGVLLLFFINEFM
jgi:hypothetical protein